MNSLGLPSALAITSGVAQRTEALQDMLSSQASYSSMITHDLKRPSGASASA